MVNSQAVLGLNYKAMNLDFTHHKTGKQLLTTMLTVQFKFSIFGKKNLALIT